MNTVLEHANILILDYSVDCSEASLFRRWLPEDSVSTAVYVNSGDNIPDPMGYSHVMHTGSSLSICSVAGFLDRAEMTVRQCAAEGIPQMGICYGHQLICRSLFGPSAVGRCPEGLEAGWVDVMMTGIGLSIPGVKTVSRVLESHFDRVLRIPETASLIARNEHTDIQGFIDRKLKLFGLQFHPEFTREDGNRLFQKDAGIFEQNGIDLQAVLHDGPTIDAGTVFFGYFFSTFPVSGNGTDK